MTPSQARGPVGHRCRASLLRQVFSERTSSSGAADALSARDLQYCLSARKIDGYQSVASWRDIRRQQDHRGLRAFVAWYFDSFGFKLGDQFGHSNFSPLRQSPFVSTKPFNFGISTATVTMTRAVRSRQHRELEASFKKQGVVVIDPPLMERVAFSALFYFGGDLRSMPAQGNMPAAAENARAFTQAVYDQLTKGNTNGK